MRQQYKKNTNTKFIIPPRRKRRRAIGIAYSLPLFPPFILFLFSLSIFHAYQTSLPCLLVSLKGMRDRVNRARLAITTLMPDDDELNDEVTVKPKY